MSVPPPGGGDPDDGTDGGTPPPWTQTRILQAKPSSWGGGGAGTVGVRVSLPAGTPGGAIRVERARDLIAADWQLLPVTPVSAGWIADGLEEWLLDVPAPEDAEPFFLRIRLPLEHPAVSPQ